MRIDYPKDRKTPDEILKAARKYAALVLAFLTVFFFFIKILFL